VLLTNFNPIAGNRTIGVIVHDGVHPSMTSNTTETNYLSRWISFTDIPGSSTSYTFTGMTLNYNTAIYNGTTLDFTNSDNVGTLSAANDQINRFDATGTWQQLQSTVSTSAATTSVT